MESINPKDILKMDIYTISFITLKNGDMIMIDESIPEKNPSNNSTVNYFRKLSISKISNFIIKRSKNFNNYNNNKSKIAYKNNFNSVSYISNNISFHIKSKTNKSLINNIPNLSLNEKIKKNDLLDFNYNNNYNTYSSKNENHFLSNRNYDNTGIKEEEKVDSRIKRKSRNYNGHLNYIFGEKNKPLVNAVISLKIPSDIKRQLTATQKQFDNMVSKLKQKRNKYKENIIYKKYKDNNLNYEYNQFDFNRIKYYHESEKENIDIQNEKQSKDININNVDKNSVNKNFYGNNNNKIINKQSLWNNDSNSYNYRNTYNFSGRKNNIINSSNSTTNKIRRYSLGHNNNNLIRPSNDFHKRFDFS